ncbi:MAG: glycoside hydrolase family 127 protein [Bacteroidaceae bacterium]|nr:glycoside hydrolase family 127 protein [Bacteroidaceae bacterium]
MMKKALPILFLFVCLLSVEAKNRTIRRVAPIEVDVPVGTVPTLPYLVWVNYSDGYGEWRQTRWMNALRQTEEEQADALRHPVGSTYEVQGYVIGDNTTDQGYPLTAKVHIVAGVDAVPAPQPVARPLPLGDVQLIGENRLTSNRDLDIREILSWDVCQQLYNYRDTYGLPTEGYPEADGWDSPTTKLKGHGSGHYMSALAFAFASAQDESTRGELRQRIRRMVDELRQCQERTFVWCDSLGRYWEARDLAPEGVLDTLKGTWAAFDEYKRDWQHYGYGYLNAIPAQHAALIECYRAYNNEDWVWAPYYSIHKQLAGLIDIALCIDDRAIADKALLIAKDMGLWVWNRLHYRTYVKTDGTREERRQRPGNRYEMWNMYIAGEVGGMAESLSRLSEMVNSDDERARLLEAASYFDAPAFFDPLSRNIDDIRTRHANQHIPMITGALRSYRGNGNPYYYRLARNFWHLVQGRYAYATGGVGNGEMFRQPYTQILSMNTNVMSDYHRNIFPNPDINETCCAYNLAKLTKDLNCYTPDDARLMDYYERVLSNQIVGSVHPTKYGVCYQYAVGLDAQKPFGNETPQSTCCGGTGAENHVKYQEATYFVSDSCLWVALYLPTTALWREQGIRLSQACQWPAERTTIRIEQGAADFSLKLRVPYWATDGFEVRLNGRLLPQGHKSCGTDKTNGPSTSYYYEIPRRHWQVGDSVEVVMPFTRHINFGPDKMDLAATGKHSATSGDARVEQRNEDETQTHFAPQWVGALMLGPLVMATPDVKSWQEAEFQLSPDLREVNRGKANSLQLRNLSFQPDYCQTNRCTHYLRLQVGKPPRTTSGRQTEKAELAQLMQVARERKSAQEAWQTMTVRVPEYAPWASHGYGRMLRAMEAGDLAALKTALSTMRPGNLAEPEDLGGLLPLLTEAKNVRDKSTELREAIQYADMVVQYVNDGSGTHDLIRKATERLRHVQK